MTDLVFEGFLDREFTAEELTMAMNVIPNMYQLVTQLGIFGNPIPLSTTFVRLEINNGVLALLPTTERGGSASKGYDARRQAKLFEIPHIAHEDAVMAAEIQNMRAFGTFMPEMFGNVVNRKLLTMAMKHFITHEWHRVGALSGIILDADGGTLLNLFTEFGVSEKVEFFGAAGGLNQHIRNVKRHIEDNLLGDVMTGVACLCSPEFYDMLLEDTDVKTAYNAAAAVQAANPNIRDVRPMFIHQDVAFIEYRGSAGVKNQDGTTTTRKFIPTSTARFFPIGTIDSAASFVAPADFIETVNMPGQLFYAKPERMKYDRGLEIHTQSNLLPIWKRPACLVKASTAAS